MQPACLVRLHPSGPWRFGPDSGERDRVETVLHSDALFSAVSSAMAALGRLEEWLDATARRGGAPAVRFSSAYPFQADLLFVIPPGSLWPPAPSLKVRWKGARLLPFAAVEALLAGRSLEEGLWQVDGLSQCLIPASWDRGPLGRSVRSNAAIDRVSGDVAIHRTACLEFAPDAGIWAVAVFADEEARAAWLRPVQSAFRLLADSGIGGERSHGWGRSGSVEFTEGDLPGLLLKGSVRPEDSNDRPAAPSAHWLLSVFGPGPADSVDWTRGVYTLITRGGRMESRVVQGASKRLSRLAAEGSVLFSDGELTGSAHDAAPAGAPHPAYRASFAVALPVPAPEGSR